MHLITDTPLTYCLIRDEFLYNMETPHVTPGFVECCIIGVVALEGRAPLFTVMLRNGALWARVPLHMLCFQPSDPLPLSTLCLWDCLSYDVSVHEYHFLSTLRVDVFCGDNVERSGTYLFTLDWCKSDYGEIPDQHKQHHIIRLDSGQIAAMPNNRLRWHEPSWIKPYNKKPDYKVHTHEWTAQRNRPLKNPDDMMYEITTG